MSKMKRTPLPLIKDCRDCGACCSQMRSPPHIVILAETMEFKSYGGHSQADFDWLMAAPAEARRIWIDGLYSDRPDESPCSWLDAETKRCRFHEFRPTVCRDFEIGERACLERRKQTGIDGDRFTFKRGKIVKVQR